MYSLTQCSFSLYAGLLGIKSGKEALVEGTPGNLVVKVCGAQVIVEAKTRNVLRLIQSACSRRVIAVPTTQVAARRCGAHLL